jgi:glycosyltransferase involved in cell wall biosynthesis
MTRVVLFGQGPTRWESSTRLSALALRTWHFAATLARSGHDVLLLSIRNDAGKITRSERSGVSVCSIPEHTCHERPDWIHRQIAAFQPDAIVGVNRVPAAVAVNFAGELPLWADVNGDPMAEAQSKAAATGADYLINDWYRKLVPVLLRADRISTCSRAQKHALVGQLGMAGRLLGGNDGYDFVSAIPNSVDDEELELLGRIERRARRPKDRFVLLWSGGYNTWCDPDLLFNTLELVMAEAPQVRFVSTGGAIEGHHTASYQRFVERVASSPFRDRIELAGWVQTSELASHYACADAAIFVDRCSYEGMLGARTRMLDWLAAGLPIVCTRLSEISIELDDAGIVLTAPCGDALRLRDHIRSLMNDSKQALERGERGRRWVQENCLARRALEPLLEWIGAPSRAPLGEARVDLEWRPGPIANVRQQANLVRSHLAELGPGATALAVGRFAVRRLRSSAARIADRLNDADAPPALSAKNPGPRR